MKQIARLDYLDLQIYAEQRSTVEVLQKDEDGMDSKSTLLVHDALAHEIFELVKMTSHSSAWGSRVLYQAESKEIFIASFPFRKSVQFKGLFFLRPDAIEQLNKVIDFLKLRKIKFLVSRLDISFIIRDPKIYQTLDRCDFKRLTEYTLKKKSQVVDFKAYNSRFNLVVYGKSAQIRKEKGNDYLEKFLSFYRLEDLPEDLFNFELRILGTDSCGEITEQILEEINLDKLKKLVIGQTIKRLKLTKKILDLLLKSPI